MSLDTKLQSIWYGRSISAWLLLPLSWLFGLVVFIRRWLFRHHWLQVVKVGKPVIVVGNISVGGTGKTPLVIWLAKALALKGYRVGVIARGYRGKAATWPQVVSADSDPELVGDESVLIAQQADVMVVAGSDRVASAQRAIELGANVIISDDGLQHYRLHRDCEIAVMDGLRRSGNGHLLPAGPLREAESRLREVDLVLVNQRMGSSADLPLPVRASAVYRVALRNLRSIKSGVLCALDSLGSQCVHVVTGIGNPESFIGALQSSGLDVSARVLRDHARLQQSDLQFDDALPILMTAKDAVKCRHFNLDDRYWAVDADAILDDLTASTVVDCVETSIKNFRA